MDPKIIKPAKLSFPATRGSRFGLFHQKKLASRCSLWTSRSITTNYAHVDVYIQEEER
jgi:hypothetical protein